MTFGGIEEATVTLEEARAEQEAELLLAGMHEDDAGPAAAGQRQDAVAPAAPSGDVPQPTAAVPMHRQRDTSDDGAGTSTGGAAAGAAAVAADMPPGAAVAAEAGGSAAKGEAAAESTAKKNNNTSVYVMGIPDDATEDEIAEEFARCGIIKQDSDGNPRIKIYKYVLMGFAPFCYLVDCNIRASLFSCHWRISCSGVMDICTGLHSAVWCQVRCRHRWRGMG